MFGPHRHESDGYVVPTQRRGVKVGGLRRFTGRGGHDLAVDLGTANTVVYRRDEGIVLFEPSVVAIDELTGEVRAVGERARRMIGRTPATIRATRPLRHGVIADFEVTEQMLRHFIGITKRGSFESPRVVLCVPSGVTEVERRAVEEAAITAGARRAYLIEEPLAAAIGADLPVADASGTMVVDIGGGTSETAVISLGGIVVANSLRVGGYELDEAIVRHVQQEHKLLIGQEQAEEVKIAIGTALALPNGEQETDVAGRDLINGLLRRVTLTADEVQSALRRPLAQIVDAVKDTLERTPPELSADIATHGFVLVGGGALLRRIDDLLRHETELPVTIAPSPLTCVALGAGQSLDELTALDRRGSRLSRFVGSTRGYQRR
jgi:rod shape-determining protein MreB and related proteins